jgi:hypothetical protein
MITPNTPRTLNFDGSSSGRGNFLMVPQDPPLLIIEVVMCGPGVRRSSCHPQAEVRSCGIKSQLIARRQSRCLQFRAVINRYRRDGSMLSGRPTMAFPCKWRVLLVLRHAVAGRGEIQYSTQIAVGATRRRKTAVSRWILGVFVPTESRTFSL